MSAASEPLTIDVVSDVVCPWCYVGKRRLETALAEADVRVAVSWRPYQLDPTIPPEGKSRRDYMQAKFGSLDRVKQVHERLEAIGEEVGIPFAFEQISVSPNTLDAHRLIRWATETGSADEVVEALFRTYFVEGRNIGDPDVLADIGAANGMNRGDLAGRLGSAEDRDAVRREIEAAQGIGVTGVPTFILAGRYALVGAQPAAEIARALETIAARQSSGEGDDTR